MKNQVIVCERRIRLRNSDSYIIFITQGKSIIFMAAVAKKVRKTQRTGKPSRLYAKAVMTGYTRGKSDQKPNHSILKIEGVSTKEDTQFYLGKRVAYVYKAKSLKSGTKYRVRIRLFC